MTLNARINLIDMRYAKDIICQSNDWKDFYDSVSTLKKANGTPDKKKIGDCFELLTKFIFQSHPYFAKKYKNVWLNSVSFNEVPSKVKEKINLKINNTEIGIDLVLETFSKKYLAVQNKFDTTERNVNVDDLSKTLTNVVQNKIKVDEIIICKNSYGISKNLDYESTEPVKISFLLNEFWHSLNKDDFKNLKRIIKKKKPNFNPRKPEKYQLIAVKKSIKHFENFDRGQLIMACGTGKTLISFWIYDKIRSNRCFFLTPTLDLINGVFKTWTTEIFALKRDVRICVFCSSEDTIQSEYDSFNTDLSGIGVELIKKPEDFQRWYNTNKKKPIVVISTYQSSNKLIDISKETNIKWDLGFFDEAHRTIETIKEKKSSLLLYDKNLICKKRLFLTATQKILKSKIKRVDMSNENIYGKEIWKLSFKDAINKYKCLTNYSLKTIDIMEDEIKNLVIKNKKLQLKDGNKIQPSLEARVCASILSIKKLMANNTIKKVISYHRQKKRASKFSKYFSKFIDDEIFSKHTFSNFVTGEHKVSERNRLIENFKSSNFSLLANARCLIEGVDIPEADTVIFVDPKKSSTDIIQAIGRVIRKLRDKTFVKKKTSSHLIVPIICKKEKNKIIPVDKNYKDLIQVIRSLAQGDTRFIDYFSENNQDDDALGQENIIEPSESVSLNLKDFNQALRIKVWQNIRLLRDLDENIILEWIDNYYKKYNTIPKATSGKLDHDNLETWDRIDACLRMNIRGLNTNMTLQKFISLKRPEYINLIEKRNYKTFAELSEMGFRAVHNLVKTLNIKPKGNVKTKTKIIPIFDAEEIKKEVSYRKLEGQNYFDCIEKPNKKKYISSIELSELVGYSNKTVVQHLKNKKAKLFITDSLKNITKYYERNDVMAYIREHEKHMNLLNYTKTKESSQDYLTLTDIMKNYNLSFSIANKLIKKYKILPDHKRLNTSSYSNYYNKNEFEKQFIREPKDENFLSIDDTVNKLKKMGLNFSHEKLRVIDNKKFSFKLVETPHSKKYRIEKDKIPLLMNFLQIEERLEIKKQKLLSQKEANSFLNYFESNKCEKLRKARKLKVAVTITEGKNKLYFYKKEDLQKFVYKYKKIEHKNYTYLAEIKSRTFNFFDSSEKLEKKMGVFPIGYVIKGTVRMLVYDKSVLDKALKFVKDSTNESELSTDTSYCSINEIGKKIFEDFNFEMEFSSLHKIARKNNFKILKVRNKDIKGRNQVMNFYDYNKFFKFFEKHYGVGLHLDKKYLTKNEIFKLGVSQSVLNSAIKDKKIKVEGFGKDKRRTNNKITEVFLRSAVLKLQN